MAHAIFRRRLLRLVELPPDERDHLDAVDLFDCVEVLETEGPRAGQRGFDVFCHSMILGNACLMPRLQNEGPTAVFDAGTW